MTKQNGINAWPNAAIWMRDELRSKAKVTQFGELTIVILVINISVCRTDRSNELLEIVPV